MKYASINRLDDFEFHDSMWKLCSFQDQVLTVDARMLNIHREAPLNPHEMDMEIELAQMTFTGVEILSFDLGYVWKTDADGNSQPEELGGIHEGKDAEDLFLTELDTGDLGATIFQFQKEDGVYTLDACGDEPWFAAQFRFDSVKIEWDTYKKPAWYTEHKWSK